MKLVKKNDQTVLSFEIAGLSRAGRRMRVTRGVRIDVAELQKLEELRVPEPDVRGVYARLWVDTDPALRIPRPGPFQRSCDHYIPQTHLPKVIQHVQQTYVFTNRYYCHLRRCSSVGRRGRMRGLRRRQENDNERKK